MEWVNINPLFVIITIAVLLISSAIITILIVRIAKRKQQMQSKTIDLENSAKMHHVSKIRKIVAPDGVDPTPNSYFIIHDGGHDCYIRSFTIDSLPKRTTWIATFPPLFNFERTVTSVFIEPIPEGKSTNLLDKTIVDIETNIITAEKDANRNSMRKLTGKLQETESWARKIESGENRFYKVYFLFTLSAESLEKLNYLSDAFRSTAKERQINLTSCFGIEPEAYLSNLPLNHRYTSSVGFIHSSGLKQHHFDKYSLSSIFNHVQTDFFHEDGIIIGRNMNTLKPVAYDCYYSNHNGSNLIFAGNTGTGKSATIKIMASRNVSKNNFRFVCIDSQLRGDRGEYSMLTDVLNGVNYQIKPDSNCIINIFELDVEEEWSELTGEYLALHLMDKVAMIKSDLLSLIQGEKEKPDFTTQTYIERILVDIIEELFEERGIRENQVDSIYEEGKGFHNGLLTSGRIKKTLPTLHDFYQKLLVKQKENKITEHQAAYRIVADSLKDYIKELHYCPVCMKFYSRKDIQAQQQNCSCGQKINSVHGSKNYYDGQSTIQLDDQVRFTNLDISSLTEKERLSARQIALSFVNWKFIKRNAINPKKTKRLGVICDELHENFKSSYAIETLDYVSRTSRKRLVSLWTATQALKDYSRTPETEAMLKQSATQFIFKQAYQDREFIKKTVNITNVQADRILELGGDETDKQSSNDRKGEVCIVDNGKVCFCKIDYLKRAEAVFVETNPDILEKMYGHETGKEVS